MSLTDKQIFDLNKMCPAAGNSDLGDMIDRFDKAVPSENKFSFNEDGTDYMDVDSRTFRFFLDSTLEFYIDEYGVITNV